MKKIFSILLAILIIITGLPMKGLTAANLYYEPSLSIESSGVPSVSAGSSTSIDLTIKNNGSNHAKNVTITPNFGGDSPFTPNNLTESLNIGDVNANSKKSVKFSLTVKKDSLEGSYPIPLSIKYNYSVPNEDSSGLDQKSDTFAETIYVRVNNAASKGKLIITEIITNPKVIVPGQTGRVSVMFENKGSIAVSNVTAKLEGLDKENGFYIGSGSDVTYVKKVDGNSTSYVDFYLKASDKIKRGGHELKVTFSYNGLDETQTIYLNAGGEIEQDSNLLIENLKFPTSQIPVNGNYNLSFELRNNGGVKAENILVQVESADSAVVPKSTSIKRITSMDPGGTESLEFIFTPTPDAITRNYPLSITVSYEDKLNADKEQRPILNQFVGLYAQNDKKEVVDDKDDKDDKDNKKKGKPKLIIDNYKFSPSIVQAGENFEMNLSFFNTNKTQTIKNIKIYLTAESGAKQDSQNAGSSAFTPVNSSNTFYIDSIGAKKRVDKRITMFTIPDALAKTHTITANLEYEDSEGNEYISQELIGVPVVQKSKLEVGEISLFPDASVGQPIPISLEFYNTGKVTLYNLMVKLEGDFQTENAQYYVGNFDSGGSDFFEGMVIPNEPGELTGAVLFTYEDSTGQPQELRQEFNLNVMEMPPMEELPGDMGPMPGEKGELLKSPWLWITVGLIIIIGGIMFIKKKKKKREKEMALDE